ncbi:MAG TPA: methylated-DNA--[protein]-cysteine S-methyltransferase [Vicinamibacterales bacterium]|nr:methylated-DNA--[protein]-cysteine S-methyltransferase [Vicinamibacterales bacterium]
MTTTTPYAFTLIPSPVGTLRLVASDKGLAGVWFERSRPERVRPRGDVENARHPVLVEAERQLREYFAGRRQTFDLKLDFVGTPFQRTVWKALLTIPFGQTRSYGQIAKQVGRPSASRAVGAANGRNPVSIVAPCHRVVGATGALTGFGGGLDVKERLLRLEGASI